jgi:proton-dependent oligopeptide transporter, POT family
VERQLIGGQWVPELPEPNVQSAILEAGRPACRVKTYEVRGSKCRLLAQQLKQLLRDELRQLSHHLIVGHPRGLVVLFCTEMWERFSYYGMRSLLVYYMMKQLMFTQVEASQIYGMYTGLVYLTPFFGGILADRILGQRRTVILGAILMAIGHFLMAFQFLFFPALVFLILGNGSFKPNISTQVANLYPEGDPRRDRAFSIFYFGVNLGGLLSPLICGTLGEIYGWHYGFTAAGVGMVIGLSIYLLGQSWLAPDNLMKRKLAAEKAPRAMTAGERKRVWGLVAVCAISVAFWATYEQQGNTIALWADTYTDRVIFGWEFPASWYQSVNPLFILILTPIITGFWSWQSRKGTEPSAVLKMAMGCLMLGGGFLIMVPAALSHAWTEAPVSMLWLFSFTLLATIGELYLSPVGLSLVTKLAPGRMVSMMMGIWLLSSFLGNYGAGFFGRYWEAMTKDGFFFAMSIIASVAGLAIMLLIRPLRRAIGSEYNM